MNYGVIYEYGGNRKEIHRDERGGNVMSGSGTAGSKWWNGPCGGNG